MMDRKERDKQLRKADILRAAEHVFASKGYHEAKIQDIAKEAQYGTGTVYVYFKDKNALYFALLEEKIKSLIDITVMEKTEQVTDARKKLEIFIHESLIFFEKNSPQDRQLREGKKKHKWTAQKRGKKLQKCENERMGSPDIAAARNHRRDSRDLRFRSKLRCMLGSRFLVSRAQWPT